MEQRTIDYGGKKLAYRIKGQGPLVVLLHGFGEDGTLWKGQYNAFPNHCLIVPDLPGSGGSDMTDDMSMEGLADAVKAIIAPSVPQGGKGQAQLVPPMREPQLIEEATQDAASSQSGPLSNGLSPFGGQGGCVVIGHSMGGYVALAFAEKYPDLVRSFGLFHSTAYADTEEKKETRRKGIAFIQEHGAEAFLKTTIPTLFSSESKEKAPGLLEEALVMAKGFSSEALITYYETMMARPDRTHVLRNSSVPVLFVMGRHDVPVPIDDVLKQCHLPSVSDVHVLESSGHMGMMEELRLVNVVLKEFSSLA